jgi:alanyl-tRNA synthetase
MTGMTGNDIRASFLKYFSDQGHRVVASSSLVPADDPTLLFTNAGMNQFKDVFLGREKRDYSRAATSQKCMRVSGKHNDLDNVGPSLRHHTFFEMLGNFSFGDYFKRDALRFAWTLLTEVWHLSPDRLVPSIFKGEQGIPRDDEAYEIWKHFVPAERILELGLDDNFWQMGETGPCGRCSEIYYVRGTGGDPEIEIWNNVFMEFERGADGTLTPLPAPSIDTGMGLERVTAVLQAKDSNYDTDLFTPVLQRIGELSGHTYRATGSAIDISMRVVADHIRSTTFLIADGVIPSNEWRGYVLRKIMRRAMRHGRHLGLTEPFLHRLVAVLDREMGDAYPAIRANREMVEKTVLSEENRFAAVLTDGLPRLETEVARALEAPDRTLAGDVAFRLYDTFGVPYDFIEDTAATQDVKVDRAGYDHAMEGQRHKARAKGSFKSADAGLQFPLPVGQVDGFDAELFRESAAKNFVGYDTTSSRGSRVVLLWNEHGDPVATLKEGESGYLSLDRTPFYADSGGQVDDRGQIRSDATGAFATVERMVRPPASYPRIHAIHVDRGALSLRDIVTAEVDGDIRDATRRNHTATHLLHAALRKVLGAHVKQAGSLVAPDRLRFDFVHFQPVTAEEQVRVEEIVNAEIRRNTRVETNERSTEEAISAGAMALFGEKYGDRVRVVSVPGFSMELCGGTHVSATGDIGSLIIVSESGVAAGVRRIEALTGVGALRWTQQQRSQLTRLIDALHVNDDQAVEAVERLQAETRRLSRDVTQLKAKLAMGGGTAADADDSVQVAGIRLARRKVSDLDKDALRQLADSLKSRIKSGVVVLASENDGKVQIIVAVTPDLTSRVKAGQIVKEIAPIVGGGGGGRPDFAEAGGKHPERIEELLQASETVLARLLA